MKWGADFSAFKQIRMIANLITQNSEYQPKENTNCKENMTQYNYLSSFKTTHLILLHKAESMYTYLNVMLIFPVSSQLSMFIMVNWGPPSLPWESSETAGQWEFYRLDSISNIQQWCQSIDGKVKQMLHEQNIYSIETDQEQNMSSHRTATLHVLSVQNEYPYPKNIFKNFEQ